MHKDIHYNMEDKKLSWYLDQYNRNRMAKDHISSIEDIKIVRKLTDEISFRLMATNKHPDYHWLHQKLQELWQSKK